MRKTGLFPVLIISIIFLDLWSKDSTPVGINWDGSSVISLAAFDMAGMNVDMEVLKAANEILRAELSSCHAFSMVPVGKINQVLAEERMTMTDIKEADAAVEIGEELETAYVSYGLLSRIGSEYYVEIFIIETDSEDLAVSVRAVAAKKDRLKDTIEKTLLKLDPSKGSKKDTVPSDTYTGNILVKQPEPESAAVKTYPKVFTESDPEYSQFSALVEEVKLNYKNKAYFDSMKALVKIFKLSPYNSKARSYLPKIYVKLTSEQKKKVRILMKKGYYKYKDTDPGRARGYKQMYFYLKKKGG